MVEGVGGGEEDSVIEEVDVVDSAAEVGEVVSVATAALMRVLQTQ